MSDLVNSKGSKPVSRTHHHHRRRLRGFGYFHRIGPGIVTGAADDDPSGIGTYSQVGAAFGFANLWTVLVSLPLAAAVQETAARLGLASGKGLAALIRERFPRPILYISVALLITANTFNIGADLGSMAAAIRLFVPLPFWLLVIAFAALILTLEIVVPYDRYAKVLRWLTLSIGAYLIELVVIKVPWGEVVRRVIVLSGSFQREQIAALIAIFGTTISPYLFVWQAAEEIEERVATHIRRVSHAHIRAMRVDVVAGMTAGVTVMFAIMVVAGTTLHSAGITQIQTADQAARALRPIAGSLASLLFAAGITGTGLLAIPTLAGSAGYALSETLGWKEGLSRKPRDAKAFYLVISGAMLAGLAMNFVGLNPIRALYFSAIINGLVAPPLLVLMLILSNSKEVGRFKGGRVSDALVGVAAVLMTGLPVLYLLR